MFNLFKKKKLIKLKSDMMIDVLNENQDKHNRFSMSILIEDYGLSEEDAESAIYAWAFGDNKWFKKFDAKEGAI